MINQYKTSPQNLFRTILPKIQSTAPAFSFTESPYNHNMHITSDGTYYYTINGGSASNGQINKFDLNGVLLQTFSIGIDGRGLSYNFTDGFLYASVYGGDIVKITDLVTGAFTNLLSGAMQNSQPHLLYLLMEQNFMTSFREHYVFMISLQVL